MSINPDIFNNDDYLIKFEPKTFKYITQAEREWFHKVLRSENMVSGETKRFYGLIIMRADYYLKTFEDLPTIQYINEVHSVEREELIQLREESLKKISIKETDYVWYFDCNIQELAFKLQDKEYTNDDLWGDVVRGSIDELLEEVDEFYLSIKPVLEMIIEIEGHCESDEV